LVAICALSDEDRSPASISFEEGMMNTPGRRASVSVVTLAVTFAATLALVGCARGPSPVTWDRAAATPGGSVVRFINEAQTYVDVYLVGETRELWLGRVGPGARTTLRIPEGAKAEMSGFIRLAVLAGAPMSFQPSHDPHATFTIPAPPTKVLSQQWTFRQTSLASAEILSAPVDLRRW
jgi:hypothetical protein